MMFSLSQFFVVYVMFSLLTGFKSTFSRFFTCVFNSFCETRCYHSLTLFFTTKYVLLIILFVYAYCVHIYFFLCCRHFFISCYLFFLLDFISTATILLCTTTTSRPSFGSNTQIHLLTAPPPHSFFFEALSNSSPPLCII